MCSICGQPAYVRCNCQSAQPFCDQCENDSVCAEIVDSQCVIYHFTTPTYTPPATRLINLNLPNGSSVQTIFEAIDAALGYAKPWVPQSTASLQLLTTGVGLPVILEGNVKVSASSGNTLSINPDGLYVPGSIYSGQIRVDSTSPLRYLAASMIGGTDGCVNIDVVDESGLVAIIPSLNIACLAGLLCGSSAEIKQELVACLLTAGLTAEDTETIDLDLGGSPLTLSANAIISPDAGNQLSAHANGLYAGGGSVNGANNGLGLNGTNVQMGGPLIQNTTIGFATGAYTLKFNSTPQILLGEGTMSGTGLLEIQNTYANNFNLTACASFTTTTALRASGGGIGAYNNLAITGGTDTDTGIKAGTYGQIYFQASVTLNSSAPESGYAGTHGIIVPSGTGTVISGTAIPAGLMGGAFASDNATITNLAAVSARAMYQSPGGTAFSGTITNYYGLYIEDLTSGLGSHITNKYAIYQTGATDISRFFGPVQNASGSAQFTSDVRVKENIVSFNRGLKEIDQIDTYNFNYTYRKQNTVTGIIAQELEKVLPEAILKDKFEVPGKDEVYDDFRFVDSNVIMYTMLNAIKELSALNKVLNERLEAVENNIRRY